MYIVKINLEFYVPRSVEGYDRVGIIVFCIFTYKTQKMGPFTFAMWVDDQIKTDTEEFTVNCSNPIIFRFSSPNISI